MTENDWQLYIVISLWLVYTNNNSTQRLKLKPKTLTFPKTLTRTAGWTDAGRILVLQGVVSHNVLHYQKLSNAR